MDDYDIRRLIKGNVELGRGIQSEKKIKIVEDYISQSTLDIWCEKEVFHPKLTQYEIHKCFILKFELAHSAFFNPTVDLYHYTFKDIVLCNRIEKVTEDNIIEYFEKGGFVDKKGTTKYIQYTTYEEGEWYVRY